MTFEEAFTAGEWTETEFVRVTGCHINTVRAWRRTDKVPEPMRTEVIFYTRSGNRSRLCILFAEGKRAPASGRIVRARKNPAVTRLENAGHLRGGWTGDFAGLAETARDSQPGRTLDDQSKP